MNIYLAFPSKFNKSIGHFFQIIVDLIKQNGHKISLELPWFEKKKKKRDEFTKDFFEKVYCTHVFRQYAKIQKLWITYYDGSTHRPLRQRLHWRQ